MTKRQRGTRKRVSKAPLEIRLFHTIIKKFTYKTEKALFNKEVGGLGGGVVFLNQSF